jgi:hypothetical protein
MLLVVGAMLVKSQHNTKNCLRTSCSNVKIQKLRRSEVSRPEPQAELPNRNAQDGGGVCSCPAALNPAPLLAYTRSTTRGQML